MTQGSKVARRPQEYLQAPITKEQAMYLLKTIWPKAPEVEVIKAGILCQQYGLNPLMRQVYLVEFGKEWVTILGIKATRQIAQQALKKRHISYSYADGPRIMSKTEQENIRGRVEPEKIWAITILKDSGGNQYPGYGWWPANKQPYGVDKGNDAFNMAFIRSERNALDKLAPGELPDIEVGDDTYIQGDYRVTLEKGKEQFIQQVEKDIDDLWGEKPKVGGSSGEITEQPPDEPEPSPEATQSTPSPVKTESSDNLPEEKKQPALRESERDPDTLRTITNMYKACYADFGLQPADTMRELKVTKWSEITESPADCYRRIQAALEII